MECIVIQVSLYWQPHPDKDNLSYRLNTKKTKTKTWRKKKGVCTSAKPTALLFGRWRTAGTNKTGHATSQSLLVNITGNVTPQQRQLCFDSPVHQISRKIGFEFVFSSKSQEKSPDCQGPIWRDERLRWHTPPP